MAEVLLKSQVSLHDVPAMGGVAAKIASRCREVEGCWEWMGGRKSDGYGNASWNGRAVRTHRAVYEAIVGPVPGGLVLDHLCRNRACCNPAHLEPVTVAENNRRGDGGTNLLNGDTCRNGQHPWPESAVSRGRWLVCQPCRRASNREFARRKRAALAQPADTEGA